MAALMIATVSTQVVLSLFTDFENLKALNPGPKREKELTMMLDQLGRMGCCTKDPALRSGRGTTGTGVTVRCDDC